MKKNISCMLIAVFYCMFNHSAVCQNLAGDWDGFVRYYSIPIKTTLTIDSSLTSGEIRYHLKKGVYATVKVTIAIVDTNIIITEQSIKDSTGWDTTKLTATKKFYGAISKSGGLRLIGPVKIVSAGGAEIPGWGGPGDGFAFTKPLAYTEQLAEYVQTQEQLWWQKGEFENENEYKKRTGAYSKDMLRDSLATVFISNTVTTKALRFTYNADAEAAVISSGWAKNFMLKCNASQAACIKINWNNCHFNDWKCQWQPDGKLEVLHVKIVFTCEGKSVTIIYNKTKQPAK